MTRNRIWETICLLLVTFTLLRPGFFWDQWYPELIERPATELVSILDEMEPNSHVRLQVKGEKFDGNEVTKTVMLSIGDEPTGEDRLRGLGLTTTEEGENLRVGMVMFGSPADRALIRFGYEITSVHVENERPPKQLMFIPALLLLALIWFSQRRRVQRQVVSAAAGNGS